MNNRGWTGISRRALLAGLGGGCLFAQQPYKSIGPVPGSYDRPGPELGPGEELRIGYFGPADASHAAFGTMWMGASLAVEEHNSAGLRPRARLLARWSEDPWRAGASDVVKLVFQDRAHAVIGGVDGATTHLAAQVAAKALVPVLDPVSTDATVNRAGVPWIFSLAPSDEELAKWAAARLSKGSHALISHTGHDHRLLANAIQKETQRSGNGPAMRVETSGGVPEFSSGECSAVCAILPADETAELVRRVGERVRVVCGPAALSRRFKEVSGSFRTTAEATPVFEFDERVAEAAGRRFGSCGDVFTTMAYRTVSALLEAAAEHVGGRGALRDRVAIRFNETGRGLRKRASVAGIIERGSGACRTEQSL